MELSGTRKLFFPFPIQRNGLGADRVAGCGERRFGHTGHQIARQAAFLLKDGSVVGTDGSSILQFNNSFRPQLFVIVWHRNNLGIMSANGVTVSGGIYAYDFSTSSTKVHGGTTG